MATQNAANPETSQTRNPKAENRSAKSTPAPTPSPRRTRPAPSPRPPSTSRSAPSSRSPTASPSWSSRSPAAPPPRSSSSPTAPSCAARVKRTERRGTTARRKATTEARKTRNRVEREARKRQRTVETTLKRNRNEVEQRVRKRDRRADLARSRSSSTGADRLTPSALDEQVHASHPVPGLPRSGCRLDWSAAAHDDRARAGGLVGPAGLRRGVGAELEADAAAVVVAEAVGVAEAAAAVGLRRCGTRSRAGRAGGTGAAPDCPPAGSRRRGDRPGRGRRAARRRPGATPAEARRRTPLRTARLAAAAAGARSGSRVPAKTTLDVAARARRELRVAKAPSGAGLDRRHSRSRGSAPAAKRSTIRTGTAAEGGARGRS